MGSSHARQAADQLARPTLVVISGPPGAGKTTLAHALARAIGCPAICRDEIKEGMFHATPSLQPSVGDELTMRTLGVFFDVLELLLRAGCSVVAEAAFQDRLWRPGLEPLAPLAAVRIVHCVVPPETAAARRRLRAVQSPHHQAVHGLAPEQPAGAFDFVSIDAPALHVDTSDGYRPGIEDIVAFVNS